MRKFILSSIVGAALTVSTFSGVFAEGNGTNKSCPNVDTGWSLVEATGDDVVFDKNGTGFVCVKEVRGRGNSRDVPGLNVRDDMFICSCASEQDVAELNEI